MAKSTKKQRIVYKKTTKQGSGVFTKKTYSGGETFHDGTRSGSPPNARRRRRKPYRGQGR